MVVFSIRYNLANCWPGCSSRLEPTLAIYMAELDVSIGLVWCIVCVLGLYRLIACGRKAPRTAGAMRSSSEESSRERHSSVVRSSVLGLAF
jgi:hypothetical protein